MASLFGLLGQGLFFRDCSLDLARKGLLCLFADGCGIRIGFASAGFQTLRPVGPLFGGFGPQFGLGLRRLSLGELGGICGFVGRLPGLLSLLTGKTSLLMGLSGAQCGGIVVGDIT